MSLTVNGAFALIDSSVSIGGRKVEGLTAINYKVAQEKTNQYGASGNVYSRARKKKTFEGSCSLYAKEVFAICESAGVDFLVDVPPFDLVVMVRNSDGEFKKRILKDFEWTEHPETLEEDQEDMVIEAPFIYSSIVSI